MLAIASNDQRRLPQEGMLAPFGSVHRRGRRAEPFAEAGVEPSIDDLLNDPVMEAILRCDHITVTSLRGLIAAIRDNLRSKSIAA